MLRHFKRATRLAAGAACVLAALIIIPRAPAESTITPPGVATLGGSFSFTSAALTGVTVEDPTSLQFGPDGRLYVAEQDGLVHAYTIARADVGVYAVTATELIDHIALLPNHGDDGTPTAAMGRQVTGLLVTGTPAQPVLYVSSTDGRGPAVIDTNSGIISRLSWNGSAWDHLAVVRGLPRNFENHGPNGLQLDAATNTLYVAQGGNTNMGAPSGAFDNQPEYALSGAVLSIDLDAIGETTYDLPTLDDPGRPNTGPGGADENDPFGGAHGDNQALLVPGGAVQVFSPGYRNPFDLLRTGDGRLYTIDNGPNAGWGAPPIGEGPGGVCTNEPNNAETITYRDGLHYISGPGYYGGHPNPTRGNQNNVFNGVSPVPSANPVECDYLEPGSEDAALMIFVNSTNGLAEYTATNFNGALQGNLLAASWDGNIYRVVLNATGDAVVASESLLGGFGVQPLDVIAQPDAGPFPGTIWAAVYGPNAIQVFEPLDAVNCDGSPDPGLDEDGDGYDNADEVDNGTNPCSAASVPPDFDGDLTSDRNDLDDDEDTVPDLSDPFAIDATNGAQTTLPVHYTWELGTPGFGFFGVGFTGLMGNGVADYLDLFDPDEMTAGGATGKVTIDNVTAGDALGAANDQAYGYQFGVAVNAATPPFIAHGRIEAPFFGGATTGPPSQGIFLGTGDQDNYIKVALAAAGGGGFVVVLEENGAPAVTTYPLPAALAASTIDLYLTVNAVSGAVQPAYALDDGPLVTLGGPLMINQSAPLYARLNDNAAPALGIIATTGGAAGFSATWDRLDLFFDANTAVGQWTPLSAGNAPTPRVDGAFVQVGGRFYLLGGQGGEGVEIYDPAINVWQAGAPPPLPVHHFQAVALDGLIYVLGAYDGAGGGATPATQVHLYDPVADQWLAGPALPTGRRRGAAALAAYDGRLYLAGGLTGPHSGSVAWLDVYDPALNSWTPLPAAPRARDHAEAAVVDGRLYLAGGRVTTPGNPYNQTVAAVDVFDLATGVWLADPDRPADVPTPRGDASVAVLGREIFLFGGEGGGQAWATGEALDTVTGGWRTVAGLGTARHGTQLADCAGVLATVTGAGSQGDAPLLTAFEQFFLLGQPSCPATPFTTPALSATGPLAFGPVTLDETTTRNVVVAHTVGDQAAVIVSLHLTGSGAFSLVNPPPLPVVVPPGGSLNLTVRFAPTWPGERAATLEVMSGNAPAVNTTLTGEGAPPPPSHDILFVVRDPTSLGASDTAVASRLTGQGHSVTLADDDTVTSGDGAGRSLVIISSTVEPSVVETVFAASLTPVLVSEARLFDDMNFTAGGYDVNYGETGPVTAVVVVDANHQAAAGLSGAPTILADDPDSVVNWGKPLGAVAVIAQLPGEPDKATLFAYEKGDEMANGAVAPARRVAFLAGPRAFNPITSDGWAFFDAAVCWATGNCLNGATPTIYSPILFRK